MIKKIFSHSLLYAVAPRVASFANILVLPFTTAKLTEIDYGIYATVAVYVNMLGAWRDLGLGTISGNTYFKHRNYFKLVWGNILGFNLVWGIFYAAILIMLLRLIMPSDVGDNMGPMLFLISFPIIVFQPFSQMANTFFQYEKNPKMIAIPTVVTGLVSVLVTFYTIYSLELGYLGWYIAAFIAQFLGFIYHLIFFFFREKVKPIFRFSIRAFRYYLGVSLPVIPHMYAGFLLHSSDRFVMDVIGLETKEIGQYGFAYTFGNYAKQISMGVNKATVPFYMELLQQRTHEALLRYRRLTFRLMSFSISASFVVCLWLREIFSVLITNPDLAVLYPLSILIVMSYNFNPMYQSVMKVFEFNERTSQLWKFSLVAGIINVVLNLIFIPIYGVYAAAFTTLIALLFLGFAGISFKSFKTHLPLNYYPFYWILAIIACLAGAYFLRDIPVLHKGVFTVVVAVVILFLEKRRVFRDPLVAAEN